MINKGSSIDVVDIDQFDSNNLETVLHRILGYVKTTTKSDAGSIYLQDGNDLVFSIFQNNSFSYETIFNLQQPLKKLKFPICENSNTIAVESFLKEKVISISDIYKSSNFCFKSAIEFDKEFDYKTKSILTAPLMDTNTNSPIGIIQLINKKDDNGESIPFTKQDQEFITLSSYLIVLSILCTRNTINELEKLNSKLEENVILRTKELKETQERLIEQINRDPMTNLYNRRYFNETVKNIFPILQRGETKMSLLMIDIDNFKNINDSYGHHTGDIVINNIADTFRSNLRNSDIAIRFGGEEFLILLTNTGLHNSIGIAEKIRKSVEQNIINLEDNTTIQYTISIGVSEVIQNDENINIALKKADSALYEAKKTGKNQVFSK